MAKKEAKKKYQAMTAAGKTDEGKADLARLAIIRAQREEAAKKRELEQKGMYLFISSKSALSVLNYNTFAYLALKSLTSKY